MIKSAVLKNVLPKNFVPIIENRTVVLSGFRVIRSRALKMNKPYGVPSKLSRLEEVTSFKYLGATPARLAPGQQ